jgi:hypothetical protein
METFLGIGLGALLCACAAYVFIKALRELID